MEVTLNTFVYQPEPAGAGMAFEKAKYRLNGKRSNLYDISNEQFRQTVQTRVASVACVLKRDSLRKSENGDYVVISTGTSFAEGEEFRDEPEPGFGTAFACTKRHVFTAGHVLEDEDETNVRLVFGFQKLSADQTEYIIPKKNVYRVKKVVKQEKANGKDYALLKLKKKGNKPDLIPLTMNFGEVVGGQKIYAVGYGEGLPVKCAYNAEIKSVKGRNPNRVDADLHTFGGNSGSPIFNELGEVIGILVAGLKDHDKDADQKLVRIWHDKKTTDAHGFEQIVKLAALDDVQEVINLKPQMKVKNLNLQKSTELQKSR
ncbi:MAG: trypsin-like peptidase domain-containing protein [Parachlamydiaceae bacterium]|nr:trypsin-like peptidase domain-containing protein [Parachlamydiaceae bacterium]